MGKGLDGKFINYGICLLQSKLETCIYIIGRLHKESL